MYLWGLLCKPGRDRISPAPTLCLPHFPLLSPTTHRRQPALPCWLNLLLFLPKVTVWFLSLTQLSLWNLPKPTTWWTSYMLWVPHLFVCLLAWQCACPGALAQWGSAGPTRLQSRHHRQGMGWRRARALRNMLWEESAGVATLLAQMDLREGQHLGQQSPEVLSWHSVGPCVQSLELRWVDSTHFCLGSHAQRAFCFSRERRVHEASCDIVEGHVCRSEEHRSPLYLFLGVVGSWLIKWRGQCWSELEAPVHGHCLPPASLCALSAQLFLLNSAQAALWGQPLPRPWLPQGPVPSPPCCGKPAWLSSWSLLPGSLPAEHHVSPLPPACPPLTLAFTTLCTSQLSCLSLTVSVLPFLLEPSTLSGNFLPGPAWTLPLCQMLVARPCS